MRNHPTSSTKRANEGILAPQMEVASHLAGKERAAKLVNAIITAGLGSAAAAGTYKTVADLGKHYSSMRELSPQISEVRKKQRQLDRRELNQARKRDKQAEVDIAGSINDLAKLVGVDFNRFYDNSGTAQALVGNDQDSDSLMSSPLFIPGMLAATVGGAYGGSKLTDNLFKTLHRNRTKNHEEQARKLYEKEIKRLQSKKAADGQAYSDQDATDAVDEMLSHLTKEGSLTGKTTGTVSGVLLTALLASLAGGHMMGRQHAKDSKQLSKSKLKREMELAVPRTPEPLYPL